MQIIRWQEATCLKNKRFAGVCSRMDYLLTRGQMVPANFTPFIAIIMKKFCIVCAALSVSCFLTSPNPDAPSIFAPGDCMILPARTRHSAEVGFQGVTCLEATVLLHNLHAYKEA